jgi:site-specific recombinase XerD
MKARTLTEIQTVDLSEFISTRDHLQPKSVARLVSDLRCFLRFLTMRGILQQDLSAENPCTQGRHYPVSLAS